MEPKTYYLIMASVAIAGATATTIKYSIKWSLAVYRFFIRMDNKVSNIDDRLTKVEGYIFHAGPNSTSNPGGDSDDREGGGPHSPFNGVGLREESRSNANGSGDRPGDLGGWDPRYPKGMVHLGLGKHAKGKRDD